MNQKLLKACKPYTLVIILSGLLVLFKFVLPFTNILSWDVFGYYLYLPAHFIYNDLALQDQSWVNHILETYDSSSTLYQAVRLENGNWVIKYTLGLSILLSPFFFLANFIAEPLGYSADGFSLPYQYLMTLGGIFYAVIGLIYSQKVLRHFFTKKVANLTLVLIFFGTNYLQLNGFDGTLLSHNFLFTFYAILMYYTVQWHHSPTIRNAIFIGISIGFITLIRPSEAICFLIPLLWMNNEPNAFQKKVHLLFSNWAQVLLIGLLTGLIFSFQMMYWKTITGNYLYYSYTNAGEGLDFLSPHTFNFLFSFRKGWLLYTPIMLFSFWGLWIMAKEKQWIWIAILCFLALDVYIASSWTTWWYAGGSFSSRSMLPAYAVLILPLGFFVRYWMNSGPKFKLSFGIILGFFTLLNVFQTWQFENGILDRQRMTRAYYFKIFGKTSVTEEDKNLLLVKRSTQTIETFTDSSLYESRVIFNESFSSNTATNSPPGGMTLTTENPYSPGIDLPFQEITSKDHAWVISEAQIFLPVGYEGTLPELVSAFHHKGKAYKYRTKLLDPNTIAYGKWIRIKFDYMTPQVRNQRDNLKVYLWHRGSTDIQIRSLKIKVFERIGE